MLPPLIRLPFLWPLLAVFLAVHGPLHASTLSDTAKEGRWAEQIIETLFDGEPVWLDAAGHEFLAIEMEAVDGDATRAAIVVHGLGVHPNWDQVVLPLRVGLAERGWHTLSIQMPILANDAEIMAYVPLFDEVSARFAAAVEYLQAQGYEDIVIAAHSMGAAMTTRYLAENPEGPVRGAALVGLSAGREQMPEDTAANLRAIGVSLLDLYGGEDFPAVMDSAPRRASAAFTAGNAGYSQQVVPGADHFFDGEEAELLDAVGGWLDTIVTP